MSVETEKETLCINQIIGQRTDTLIIEDDCVVPDIKPDILNSIDTSGTVCIYKKEIVDGKIKIDGCVNVYIMYIADDENSSVRSINTNLDFSQVIDMEKAKVGMLLDSEILLKSVECRVINGRKINIKSILEVNLKVFSNENLEFVREIKELRDIQLLNNSMDINSLLGNGTTKVYAKDTITIDDIDDLAEILKVNIDIKNKETKISYNKILVKADADVKIMYLTNDNRVKTVTNIIPVMGFMDMPNVVDDNICDIKYEIKNLIIKPNSIEEHSIYIEIEMELSCNVYETRNIQLIQDLYSPSTNLNYKQKTVKVNSQKHIFKDLYCIKDKQIISEIQNERIYNVDVCPNITNKTITKDRILYEGELELKFLYATDSISKIDLKIIKLPFNYNMECLGVNPSSNIETNIEINNQDFIVMPDNSIDIKVDLEFILNISNSQNINVIEDITIEENRTVEKYSLIIYFVKPGDTLWNIAKRFKSTINDIVKINQIEDENKIDIGKQLFIPISA